MRIKLSAASVLLVGLSSIAPSVSASSVATTPDVKTMATFLLTSATGQPTTFSLDAGTYIDASGTLRTYTTTVAWICTGTVDNPHYSTGAGGVIAKVKVTCSGPDATLPVEIYALLGRTTVNDVSTLQVVAVTDKIQNVVVNSLTPTVWWVPDAGVPGAQRGAYFRASASGQFAPPLLTYYFSAGASNFLYVS